MESFDWAITAYRDGAAFAAFDIETTGLDSRQDRIAEFGAIRFDKQGIISRYSTLVDPGIPMPEEAGRVNHITPQMLAGQPSLEAALPDFLLFIKNAVIVAHNAPFDCGFVNESLARLHSDGLAPFPGLPNRIADTLVMVRRIFPGRPRYNLQDMAAFLGIQAQSAHRALDDARLCMEIFTACCKAAAL
ncbi:MAG: 3'-5' exonuclease [Treponema sp.]|nr:3'-5' exonuclease [Treponema sp.]